MLQIGTSAYLGLPGNLGFTFAGKDLQKRVFDTEFAQFRRPAVGVWSWHRLWILRVDQGFQFSNRGSYFRFVSFMPIVIIGSLAILVILGIFIDKLPGDTGNNRL